MMLNVLDKHQFNVKAAHFSVWLTLQSSISVLHKICILYPLLWKCPIIKDNLC